jgi:micrococcal nuclease
VTLTATPSGTPDQRFLGFTGDCTPQTAATCTASINGDRSVTATFGHCAASYPTVCIPPPPPDLDCGDITYRNFTVLYNVPDPDPHGFDGDNDGVGCET